MKLYNRSQNSINSKEQIYENVLKDHTSIKDI
jgi:hypothetical protein